MKYIYHKNGKVIGIGIEEKHIEPSGRNRIGVGIKYGNGSLTGEKLEVDDRLYDDVIKGRVNKKDLMIKDGKVKK